MLTCLAVSIENEYEERKLSNINLFWARQHVFNKPENVNKNEMLCKFNV